MAPADRCDVMWVTSPFPHWWHMFTNVVRGQFIHSVFTKRHSSDSGLKKCCCRDRTSQVVSCSATEALAQTPQHWRTEKRERHQSYLDVQPWPRRQTKIVACVNWFEWGPLVTLSCEIGGTCPIVCVSIDWNGSRMAWGGEGSSWTKCLWCVSNGWNGGLVCHHQTESNDCFLEFIAR